MELSKKIGSLVTSQNRRRYVRLTITKLVSHFQNFISFDEIPVLLQKIIELLNSANYIEILKMKR